MLSVSCLLGKSCLFASLQLILILFPRFQPIFFNGKFLFFSLQPCVLLLIFLRFQPCLFNEVCILFRLYPCVLLLLLRCPYCFKD